MNDTPQRKGCEPTEDTIERIQWKTMAVRDQAIKARAAWTIRVLRKGVAWDTGR